MVEESYKNSKLKGRSNYLEWNTRFKAMAKIKKWKNTAGNFISTTSDEILEWLINNISDSAIGCVDPDLDIEDVLEAISNEHGFGYMNPDAFLESIRELIAFPVLKKSSNFLRMAGKAAEHLGILWRGCT